MLRPLPSQSLLALSLLLLASCGGSAPGTAPAPEAAPAGAGAPGPISPLYNRGNCHTCHGPALAGTQLGPALANLGEHWNQETLVEYLTDPRGVTDRTPRLRERRALYMMAMPPAAQAGLSREDIRELAAWLLAKDEP